jgi:hypothetical protein
MRTKEALMDYGRPVQFGLFLTPDAGQPHEVLRLARLADQLGLDLWSQQGSAHDWVDRLTALTTEHGMATYVLGTDSEEELRRFATEVAPHVWVNVYRRRSAVG